MVKLILFFILYCMSFLGFTTDKSAKDILDMVSVEKNIKLSNTNLTFETKCQ